MYRERFWNFFTSLYEHELTADSARAATPEWIRTPLLRHQQAAVAAALNLEKAKTTGMEVGATTGDPAGGRFFTSYGILGDVVGSGKSLTALSLVRAPAPSSTYTEFCMRSAPLHDGRDVGLLRQRSQLTHAISGVSLNPTTACLFIVPHALIGQWESYTADDTTLRCRFIKKRADVDADDLMTTLNSYDAIFVSSTMYNPLKMAHPTFTRVLWKRAFIDEADSIHISTGIDEINANFYWFISASWMNLVFSGGGYFNVGTSYIPLESTPPQVVARVRKLIHTGNILSFPGVAHVNIARRMCGLTERDYAFSVNPAGYQSARLIIHASEEFIKSSFAVPKITHKNILCATPHNISVLTNVVSEEMMERLHAGDIGSALSLMGMSAHDTTEITDAVTENLQKELDNAQKTLDYKKSITYSAESVKQKAIEVCEQKIASILSRIQAIKDRISKASEQVCPICYCEVANAAVTPCCSQVFCFGCLCESLKRVAACPLCRDRISDLKSVKVVGAAPASASGAGTAAAEEPAKPPNKKEAFLRYMDAHKDARILMFSNYDASFDQVVSQLTAAGFKTATVNGSQARISKLMRDFREGKYNVLFLNARNMGAGLNIESATHIVLYHKMSMELENQIVGRAVRLGRTADLEVVHLLHENEQPHVITHV